MNILQNVSTSLNEQSAECSVGRLLVTALLKVDDSVSFRAINKIIRFTVLHDRQFTSSERGM